MYAAEKGNLILVHKLLYYKANVSLCDKHNKNALYYSIDNNTGENSDVVCSLIRPDSDINIVTDDDMTPLMKATEKSYENIVKNLLLSKANPNVVRKSTSTRKK